MRKKDFTSYAIQIVVIALVGYMFWIFLYGKPGIPLPLWLLLCLAAALLGLIPYGISALLKRRGKD